jgi:hypothetical protein
MISRAEQQAVWTNAYNAVLTGLLSAKSAHMERYTATPKFGFIPLGPKGGRSLLRPLTDECEPRFSKNLIKTIITRIPVAFVD